MWYYIDKNNNRKGPVASDKILNITPETLVWKEGMPEWLPAAQVSELASLLPPPTPQGITPPPLPTKDKKNLYAGITFAALVLFVVGYFALNNMMYSIAEQQYKAQKQTTEINNTDTTVSTATEQTQTPKQDKKQSTQQNDDHSKKMRELQYCIKSDYKCAANIELSDFYYKEIGGVSDLTIIYENKLPVKINNLSISIHYYNRAGVSVYSNNIALENIAPNQKYAMEIPETTRGVDVGVSANNITIADYGIDYSYVQGRDLISPIVKNY